MHPLILAALLAPSLSLVAGGILAWATENRKLWGLLVAIVFHGAAMAWLMAAAINEGVR